MEQSQISDLGSLIDQFDKAYTNTAKGPGCSICNSQWKELVDTLLERGAAKAHIAKFLTNQLFEPISETTIRRHSEHPDGQA